VFSACFAQTNLSPELRRRGQRLSQGSATRVFRRFLTANPFRKMPLQNLEWGTRAVGEWMMSPETEVSERVTVFGVGRDEAPPALREMLKANFPDGGDSEGQDDDGRWELVLRTQSEDVEHKVSNLEVCCTRLACPGRLGTKPTRLPVVRFFVMRYARREDYGEIRLRRVGPFEGYEPRCHCREKLESLPSSPKKPARRRSNSTSMDRDKLRAHRRSYSGSLGAVHETAESASVLPDSLRERESSLEQTRTALRKERAKFDDERREFEEERRAWEAKKRKSKAHRVTASALLNRSKEKAGNTDANDASMEIPWSQLAVDTSRGGQLGVGGWGKVQRGWWLGTPVAVKLVEVIRLRSGTVLDRAFQRELQSLDRARHPNVVALLAWASREEESQMALVTEVCSESLQEALDDRRAGDMTANTKV
jgi:Protein kinase domain